MVWVAAPLVSTSPARSTALAVALWISSHSPESSFTTLGLFMISVMTRSPGARPPLEPPVPWLPVLLVAPVVAVALAPPAPPAPVLLAPPAPVVLAPPAPLVLPVPVAVIVFDPVLLPAAPPLAKGDVSPVLLQPSKIDTAITPAHRSSRDRFMRP